MSATPPPPLDPPRSLAELHATVHYLAHVVRTTDDLRTRDYAFDGLESFLDQLIELRFDHPPPE